MAAPLQLQTRPDEGAGPGAPRRGPVLGPWTRGAYRAAKRVLAAAIRFAGESLAWRASLRVDD
jgi:hypothetical protein